MAKYDFTNEVSFNEQPLYKQGYEDAVNKACEWLKNNYNSIYWAVESPIGSKKIEDTIVDMFIKSMEE